MRMPDAWIESLLKKMAAMYGERFLNQWKSVTREEMVGTWIEALGPYCDEGESRGTRIKWALGQLLQNNPHPPTLPEFIALCRQAPRPQQPALPAPVVAPEVARERAKAVSAQLSAFGSNVGHKRWAHDILKNPKAYPPISLKLAKEALCDASAAEK